MAADQQFVVAVNNYRQSGGGNFPHVKTAPVVYNRQVEIRQLMIDYVTATGDGRPGRLPHQRLVPGLERHPDHSHRLNL